MSNWPPPIPEGLSAEAEQLFRDVVETWVIRPDELANLRLACEQLTQRDALLAFAADKDIMIKGSRGQMELHPARVEARMLADSASRLMARLNLPDDQETEARRARERSAQMGDLARIRHRKYGISA